MEIEPRRDDGDHDYGEKSETDDSDDAPPHRASIVLFRLSAVNRVNAGLVVRPGQGPGKISMAYTDKIACSQNPCSASSPSCQQAFHIRSFRRAMNDEQGMILVVGVQVSFGSQPAKYRI